MDAKKTAAKPAGITAWRLVRDNAARAYINPAAALAWIINTEQELHPNAPALSKATVWQYFDASGFWERMAPHIYWEKYETELKPGGNPHDEAGNNFTRTYYEQDTRGAEGVRDGLACMAFDAPWYDDHPFDPLPVWDEDAFKRVYFSLIGDDNFELVKGGTEQPPEDKQTPAKPRSKKTENKQCEVIAALACYILGENALKKPREAARLVLDALAVKGLDNVISGETLGEYIRQGGERIEIQPPAKG